MRMIVPRYIVFTSTWCTINPKYIIIVDYLLLIIATIDAYHRSYQYWIRITIFTVNSHTFAPHLCMAHLSHLSLCQFLSDLKRTR